MRKIIGDSSRYVDDALAGILVAHTGYLEPVEGDLRALARPRGSIPAKVGLVTGGGFGHLPLFLGYVGDGLLDGVAVGNVFASPGAETMARVIRAVDSGAGVVVIIGNYTGDGLNFEMAVEMVKEYGISVEIVRVTDDVASAPPDRGYDRRGIAGLALAFKVAGALARHGASLSGVCAELSRTLGGLKTMGVALGPCTIPEVGHPSFDLPEGSMELGMGIHGEPGVQRTELASATHIAEELVGRLLADYGGSAPERVAVLVNGLGATSVEELYVLYGAVHEVLLRCQVTVDRSYIGEFSTSMEMSGASVTLLQLNDRICDLLDEPVNSPLLSLWKSGA